MKIGWVEVDKEINDFPKLYISVIVSQSIYSMIGAMFRITIDWFINNRNQQQLEQQNIKNELAVLRSQINPHFLFNTLNNIHSFVYRDQDKTSYALIKLSEIMRYMLYEANADRVLLEKEIEYVKNYIELQKLRYKDPDFVDLKIEGDISGKMIPPLLLITLVENAFKHGKKSTASPGISISLKTINNSLTFDVVNYVYHKPEAKNEFSGFGLKNLERRLELIYGKEYKLDISKNSEQCFVKLQINNL
jgi:LytS/YehU family sensor histidine kinase